jgi:hypothetical protein
MEAAALSALAVHTPKWLSASLREQSSGAGAAFAEHRRAVVRLLDITGFAGESARLSRLGSRGAEQFSDTLNSCFTALFEFLDSHGGDVAAFAGNGRGRITVFQRRIA